MDYSNYTITEKMLIGIGRFFAPIIAGKLKMEVKPMVKTELVEFPVVGVKYHNRQNIIRYLKGDEKLSLIKVNLIDYPSAVGVFAGSRQIGFIPDKGNPTPAEIIRQKMDAGEYLGVNSWYKLGGSPGKPNLGVRLKVKFLSRR